MAFVKGTNETSIINESTILDQSNLNNSVFNTHEESKHGAHTSRDLGNSFDPNNLYDPKYIETKKIENL